MRRHTFTAWMRFFSKNFFRRFLVAGFLLQSCSGDSSSSSPPSPTSATVASLTFSADTFAFGFVNSGSQSTSHSIRISNLGTADATHCAIVPGDSTNFSIGSTTACEHIPASGFCDFSVSGAPASSGFFQTSFAIYCDNSISAASTSHGISVSSITGAQLAISPATWDFGNVVVSATSAPQTFQITNSGGSKATSCTVSIDNTDFSLNAANCAEINSGASCSVDITSTPLALGATAATLAINCAGGIHAASSTAGITANGTSPIAPPNLTVQPTSQDFGTIAAGAFSPWHTFTFSNTGGLDATQCQVSASLSDFEFRNNTCGNSSTPLSLAAGGTCSVEVRSHPLLATGGISGSALLQCGSYSTSATLQSTSIAAYPGPAITSYSNNLGTVAVGSTTSNTGYFRIQNYSGSAISGCSFNGSSSLSDPVNFQIISNPCGNSIGAYSYCDIGVVGKPQSAGTFTTEFSFTCSNSGTYSSTNSGMNVVGAAPIIYWNSTQTTPNSSSTDIDLGTLAHGTWVTKNIYAYNVGAVNGLNCQVSFAGDVSAFPAHVANGNPSTIYHGSYSNIYWLFGPVPTPGSYQEDVTVQCDGAVVASTHVHYISQ